MFYTHMHTYAPTFHIDSLYVTYTHKAHALECILEHFQKSYYSLISTIILLVPSTQAVVMWEDSCPSAQEEKALGSEPKNFLHLPAAQGFRCIPVWLEYKEVYCSFPFRINQLPSCQIHSLLFSWSRGHTSSEWRINSSFGLKSNEQFLKAQIYIL